MAMFMIIAKVKGTSYMTRVETETACGAEHYILDLGVCGKHEYGVEACMAYDFDAMATETFRYEAFAALPVSFAELVDIISRRNEEIEAKDAAEKRLQEIEKEKRELAERLEMLKAEEDAALNVLNG